MSLLLLPSPRAAALGIDVVVVLQPGTIVKLQVLPQLGHLGYPPAHEKPLHTLSLFQTNMNRESLSRNLNDRELAGTLWDGKMGWGALPRGEQSSSTLAVQVCQPACRAWRMM